MNILIFSWRDPEHPNAGGAEISTHEHAKGWVQAGHDVTLFTSAFKGCKKQEIIDGVKVIRRGSQVFGVQIEAIKWYLFSKHPKFDLVVDQFHGIPFFTPLYVQVKKLAFIHEVAKDVWKFNPWPWPFNKIAALIGGAFEPLVFKLLYKKVLFMTVSDSTRNDLIKWEIPEKNITVIHNGVRVPRFAKLPKKEKEKTIFFLGAMSKDKGIEDALEIFAQILQKQNGWRLWIAGISEPRYFKFLMDKSKRLGIDRKVRFLGFVPEKKKYELLTKAHILINPSVREGWGLVVIEAASVGTPTVGYDVPGLRDSIINNKTGIICRPTPAACSEAILTLIADHNRYRALREAGIEWGKKFKWENAYGDSLKLIEKVLSLPKS